MYEKRDKFLTLAIGECWHETTSFSTWDRFGKLLEWFSNKCKSDDKFFSDFEEQNYHNSWIECTGPYVYMFDLNPDKFANAVYEYLKGK
jgi:hypothetical protein